MTTGIVWTEPAVSDLDSIHAYISRDSTVYADSVLAEIFDASDRLIDYPESGRVVPEIDDASIRELIVGNYRVMYELCHGGIQILAVIHGARKFPNS